MTAMTFTRHVLHPVGWLAGFRAGLVPGLMLVLAAISLFGGWADKSTMLLTVGIAFAAAAVVSGVVMAYAAASADRRRTPRTPTAHELRGDDVLAIIDHIDKKVDGLETKILSVIKEGQDAHTREHEQQQLVCAHSMAPLQTYVNEAQAAEVRRDARVQPLVSLAQWATNHWVVAVGIVTAILALLVKIGVIQ
jgi:hypothetical protein